MKQKVSRKLYEKIKLDKRPLYCICAEADVNPSTFSKMMHGYGYIRPDDTRVIRVGEVLDLKPEECFEVLEAR